jgi:hypothetical protein
MRRILTALALVGLVFAPLTAPAAAYAHAVTMAVHKDMPCCPEAPTAPDCQKCPLAMNCATSSFLGLLGDSHPLVRFEFVTRRAAVSDDAARNGLGFAPHARPPRSLV